MFPRASCTSLPNWWNSVPVAHDLGRHESTSGWKISSSQWWPPPCSYGEVVSIILFLLWDLCYPAAPFRACLHPLGTFNNCVLVGPWRTKHKRETCGKKRQTEITGIPAANDQRKRTVGGKQTVTQGRMGKGTLFLLVESRTHVQ